MASGHLDHKTLSDIKTEYRTCLCDMLVPVYYQQYKNTYETAKKQSKKQQCMVAFQNELVKRYEYASDLESLFDLSLLDKLISACFVSTIQLLTLNSKPSTSSETDKDNDPFIDIPTCAQFVRDLDKKIARSLFSEPMLYKDYDNISSHEYRENQRKVKLLIESCIDHAIRSMIPMKKILTHYLGTIKDRRIELVPVVEALPPQPPVEAVLPQPQPSVEEVLPQPQPSVEEVPPPSQPPVEEALPQPSVEKVLPPSQPPVEEALPQTLEKDLKIVIAPHGQLRRDNELHGLKLSTQSYDHSGGGMSQDKTADEFFTDSDIESRDLYDDL